MKTSKPINQAANQKKAKLAAENSALKNAVLAGSATPPAEALAVPVPEFRGLKKKKSDDSDASLSADDQGSEEILASDGASSGLVQDEAVLIAQASRGATTDAPSGATASSSSGAAAPAQAGGMLGIGGATGALFAVGIGAAGLLISRLNESDDSPQTLAEVPKAPVPPVLVAELTEVNVSDEAAQGKSTIVLTFDKALDSTNAPVAGSFIVKINGSAVVVDAVEVTGSTLKLILAAAVPAGALNLSVAYQDPTSSNDAKAIQVADGTDAQSFELLTGVVADGYIRGAQVFVDTDKDGKFGAKDIPVGTTDENGRFFVSKGVAQAGDIVVQGGVNIDTGVPNTMVLKAPASSLVVNPLTTLVTAVMQTSKVDAAAAVQQVATALNLVDADNKPLDLTSFDPIAKASADPTDEVAVAAQKAAAKVASIVSLVVEANNDGGATAAASAADKVISNLASTVSEAAKSSVSTTVDLSAAQVVASALTGAVSAEKVEAVKTEVQTAVTAIAAAADLTAIATAQSQALDSTAPAKPTDVVVRPKTNDTTPAIEVVLPLKDANGKWLADGTAAVSGDTVVLSLGSNSSQTYVLKDADIVRGKAIIDWSTSLAEGSYTIKARLEDRAGNTIESNVAQASFEIDLTLPAVTSTALSMPENSTASAALTANESVTWLLGTGADTSLFSLSNGALSFKQAQDFDTAAQTTFTVNVVATDIAGNVKNQAITVNLTNVNEVPTAIALSASTIAENVTVGSGVAVGDLTVTDPDASGNNNALTLEGADSASFAIVGSKLIFTGSSPNFEAKSSYSVTVKSADGVLTLSQPFTINVTNVNEAPTAIALSASTIAENVTVGSAGVVIGMLSVTDPDATGNNNVLSIEPGADAASFNVVDGNKLVFIGASPNFEAKSSYSVTVKSTDGALTYSQTFTVNVSDVDEAPVLANPIADQVFVVGGSVDSFQVPAGTFSDPEGGALTYSATLENGSALPSWLTFNPQTPSFTGNPTADGQLSIKVTASDGKASVSDTFELRSVTAPAVQGFSVSDATISNGSRLGKAGEALSFTVTLSEAVTSTAALTATINLNGTSVEATSPAVSVATNTLQFTGVTIPAGNNGSTITLTGITTSGVVGQVSGQPMVPITSPIAQGASNAYTVDTKTPTVNTTTVELSENSTASVSLTADEAVTWSKGTGDDTDLFDFNGGSLSFKTQQDFETATKTTFTANVVATDAAGNAKNQAVTVTLKNVNEAPSISSEATANFDENGTGAAYTTVATDPDASTTLTYSLGGADKDLFNISSAGVVSFRSAPNFEQPADAGANNVYNFSVTVSDGTLTATKEVAVTVRNVNEAPTVTSGATASFNENGTGTVYTATATDPDANTTLSYSLGGDDKDLFNISATGVVTFKSSPNFESPADVGADNVYNITVIASDGSLSGTKNVAITVANVNDAPVVANAIPDQFFVVGGDPDSFQFSASAFADEDVSNTLTYSASQQDGSALPSWLIFSAQTRTFSGNPTADGQLSIKVTASDGTATVSDTFDLKSVSAPTVQSFTVIDNDTTVNSATLGKAGEPLMFVVKLSMPVVSAGPISATFNLNGTPVTASVPRVTVATDTLQFLGADIPANNNGSAITLTSIDVAGVTAQQGGQQLLPVTTAIAQSTQAPYTVDTTVPTVVTLPLNLPENSTAGVALQANETVTWAKGTGGDEDLFSLEAGLLAFTSQKDFETATKKTFTVNVVATDAAGNAKNQALTVNLTDVNEAPSISSGATASVEENSSGTVYSTAASDPDANTTLTYTLSGPDALRFNVSSAGAVTFRAAPNFESPLDVGANNVYNFTVTASDGTLTATKEVAVTVTNLNEAPVFSATSAQINLAENTASVGNAGAADPDAGDAITYTLSGTDASAFKINATTGALTFKSSPNYETDAKTYSVVVTATDKSNLSATQALTVNITDVLEKVEFRKGAVTNDVVTLEVWVDPGASFGSVDLQLTFADAASFSIDVNAATSPLTFAQSGWTALASEESPGSYLMGGYNATEVADTPSFQKLLSIAVQRDEPTTEAIAFSMASVGLGDYFSSQPTDYVFSLV